MKHGNHLYLMIGLAVMAGVLYFTGAISGGWVLIVLLGACAAMMLFMMGGMGGMGGGRQGGEGHSTDFVDRDR